MIAIYPGSFDPVTSGHIDIIKRGADFCDKVIVAVVKNPPKAPLFSLGERVKFLKTIFLNDKKVEVETFDSLVVELAKEKGARTILRGLRAVSDFEHEFQMAQLNRKLNPEIETIFVMASPEHAYLSSSIVKEIAEYGGSVKGLVPKEVEVALQREVQQVIK